MGFLWCLTRLPFPWLLRIGQLLGYLAYGLAKRRRRIAAINLKLCFPELDDRQRRDLLRKHFASLGMGLLEIVCAWWLPDKVLQPKGQVQGLEHLHAALARGKGVILLCAHFTSLDLGTRFLTMRMTTRGVYRPHENPVVEYLMKKGRERHAEKAIPRDNVREILRSLKQNKLLWFAVDQNFGHKNRVFANFFGIPAATNTATARLAQISGAAVVPFFTRRLANSNSYLVFLQPALEKFPSSDDLQDTSRINQLIEQQIRQAPEQYLWVHRRFKDRPAGEKPVYTNI